MTVLADFNFEDGHELSDYNIENSPAWPITQVNIKDNTLMLCKYKGPHLEGEIPFRLKSDLREGILASFLLKNAHGYGFFHGPEEEIMHPFPQDCQRNTRIFRAMHDDNENVAYIPLSAPAPDGAEMEFLSFTGYQSRRNLENTFQVNLKQCSL